MTTDPSPPQGRLACKTRPQVECEPEDEGNTAYKIVSKNRFNHANVTEDVSTMLYHRRRVERRWIVQKSENVSEILGNKMRKRNRSNILRHPELNGSREDDDASSEVEFPKLNGSREDDDASSDCAGDSTAIASPSQTQDAV